MRVIPFFLAALLAIGLSGQEAPKRKKILAIGQTKGFQHDSTSDGLATIWKIGKESVSRPIRSDSGKAPAL